MAEQPPQPPNDETEVLEVEIGPQGAPARPPVGRGPIIAAVSATTAGLILIILFAVLLLQDGDDTEVTPTGPSESLPETEREQLLIEAASESGTISVTLEAPVFLEVAGSSFSVQPQTIPIQGTWSPVSQGETTALWVFGSVVNYVFGVPNTEDNRALLDSLALGDELVISTRSGRKHTFTFSSRDLVESSDGDVFAQHAPGITLLLLGGDEDDERLTVRGRYVVAEAEEVEPGRALALGETAQLDNLQLTLTAASYQANRPEIPAGFAFYVLDFQLENVGNRPVDSAVLNMMLADDLGTLYAPNPAASQLGGNRLLGGTISPGGQVVASTGFQIPAGLASTELRWRVTRSDTQGQVVVAIPFRDDAERGTQANVQLQQAEVSLDGASLQLAGQISNLGDKALVVAESDVTLRGDGTVYLLFSTNPGFPWLINPGQTIPFSVTFQRPTGSTAVFQLLSHPFQLDGLR